MSAPTLSETRVPPAVPSGTDCWLCSSSKSRLLRPSSLSDLGAENFRITDSSYGTTAAIYECAECGFFYCPDSPDVLPFYQNVSDDE